MFLSLRVCARSALFGSLTLMPGCGQEATAPVSPAAAVSPPAPPPTTSSPDAPEPTPVPDEVAAWLDANVHPFDGPHLSLPSDDLQFLPELVGDARIVSLGEGTHGTRDFFEMKARILRFLVEEMGFNTFAIEATWPEARLLDRYVRTGEGNPARLLADLYFWTWNTESVLEMIEWMRAHNEAGGDIGFHGFDMQYPGLALRNVRDYMRRVDPENTDRVSEQIRCLSVFANNDSGIFPNLDYGDQTAAYRDLCGASLDSARDWLLRNRTRYEAAGGADAFEVALQSLRVAYQYHLRDNFEDPDERSARRDEFMAENVEWISRRIGPEGRMALWAHNYHISTQPGAQGFHLRETFGDAMLIIGFSHERGRFSAIRWFTRFVGSEHFHDPGPLLAFDLDTPLESSIEHYLSGASAPRFMLDLRNRDANSAATSWLSETRPFRDIGCCYDPDHPDHFWEDTPLAEWFDVIVHFETTRPTVILPF